jgi:IS30 family transposase
MRGGPPITAAAAPPGPSRSLRVDDRIHIADRLREEASVRTIATELGRAPSTISREIRRNRHPLNGQYRPHAAHARADARRPRPKTGKIAANRALRRAVQGRLETEWSPEQIGKTLLIDFPAQPEMQVSHETIYQALYVQGRGELRRELTRAPRTGRARRIPRRRPDQRQPRFTAPMVMISEAPRKPAIGPFPAAGKATSCWRLCGSDVRYLSWLRLVHHVGRRG